MKSCLLFLLSACRAISSGHALILLCMYLLRKYLEVGPRIFDLTASNGTGAGHRPRHLLSIRSRYIGTVRLAGVTSNVDAPQRAIHCPVPAGTNAGEKVWPWWQGTAGMRSRDTADPVQWSSDENGGPAPPSSERLVSAAEPDCLIDLGRAYVHTYQHLFSRFFSWRRSSFRLQQSFFIYQGVWQRRQAAAIGRSSRPAVVLAIMHMVMGQTTTGAGRRGREVMQPGQGQGVLAEKALTLLSVLPHCFAGVVARCTKYRPLRETHSVSSRCKWRICT